MHWAAFVSATLQKTWDTCHWSEAEQQAWCTLHQEQLPDLWIASVVPAQAQLWQHYPSARFVTLPDVPLLGMYETFGIDRALSLWGAIQMLGSPVLVIDAGTALTFTGATGDRLVGGAILPGLRLQFQALHQATAQLPLNQTATLPIQWALNTPDAIASGILQTLLAGIQAFVTDWRRQFPGSAVVMTGGDCELLHQCLQARSPEVAAEMTIVPQLIFWGIQAIRSHT